MWDYRIVRKQEKTNDKTFIFYSIYEVYYDENENITSISEESPVLYGDSILSLLLEVKRILLAFTRPILDFKEISDMILRQETEDMLLQNQQLSYDVAESPIFTTENSENHIEKKRVESEKLYEDVLLPASEDVVFDFIRKLPIEKRIH